MTLKISKTEAEFIAILRTLPEDRLAMLHRDLVAAIGASPARPLKDIGKEKKGGLLDWISNLFKDEKKEQEKKQLQKFLKDNYGKLKGLEKTIKENRDLADYLSTALEGGELDAKAFSVMTELLIRDPDWTKKIDLKDADISKSNLVVKLSSLSEYITEADYTLSSEQLVRALTRLFKVHAQTEKGLSISVDDPISDGPDRTVEVSGSMMDLLKIIKEFKIKPEQLLMPL